VKEPNKFHNFENHS